METFTKLFASWLTLVYHCFDRIVIQGYLPLPTREAHIVHFLRDVHHLYPITKEVSRQRTRMNISTGSKPTLATTIFPCSGPKKAPLRSAQDERPRAAGARGSALRLPPHPKGTRVAALFVFFHKRVCGPLANSLFHHRPTSSSTPPAKIEVAYHKADTAIQDLIDQLAA
jgi:hypothetical protein